MKSFLCAANWKMNKTPREATGFLKRFLEECPQDSLSHFAFFVPAISLSAAADSLTGTSVSFGAQNIYFEKNGAFTGENSAEMVASLQSTHCLVGHSERRALFSESNEWTNKKVKAVKEHGMVPVLCVGESLEDREAGRTNDVITQQLQEGLAGCEPGVIVAYEPVWAIGTGKVATPEQANEAHIVLRKNLIDLYGDRAALDTHILYGGSVKPENAKRLSEQSEIDGFLIGGASLNVESLLGIFQNSVI